MSEDNPKDAPLGTYKGIRIKRIEEIDGHLVIDVSFEEYEPPGSPEEESDEQTPSD
jgi:hypothetical protein